MNYPAARRAGVSDGGVTRGSYAPDNTRSSFLVIVMLTAAVTLVALLIGLSEKPNVEAIGISLTAEEIAAAGGPAIAEETPAATAGQTADPAFTVPADGGTDTASASDATFAESTQGTLPTQVVVTPIPLDPTPAPTPEIAAAVDPDTTILDDADEFTADLDDAALAVSPIAAGTIAGEVFVQAQLDEGAAVARNELVITLSDDGSGTFAAVLDMTLADSTHVLMSMSGPIRWGNDEPQIEAELTGTFSYDSPIDADDLNSTTAELMISSLTSGVGSICPDICYGIRFDA